MPVSVPPPTQTKSSSSAKTVVVAQNFSIGSVLEFDGWSRCQFECGDPGCLLLQSSKKIPRTSEFISTIRGRSLFVLSKNDQAAEEIHAGMSLCRCFSCKVFGELPVLRPKLLNRRMFIVRS